MKLKIFALLSLSLLMNQAALGATLEIGSPAPSMKIDRWLKGPPVETFQEGQVYVIEFWATWCPPCVSSIPHLNKLHHKYAGKVHFVGVAGSERGSSAEEKLST